MMYICCRVIPRFHYSHLLSIAFVIVVCYVTFGLLLPVMLHDRPYSAYYRDSWNHFHVISKIVSANDQRYVDAKAYLQTLPEAKPSTVGGVDSSVDDVEQYDLVIIIITMSRERAMIFEDLFLTDNLGYLTQTVAQLLQIVHTDDTATFQRKKLVVCSVDPQPQRFTEAWDLSNFVHTVFRYQNNSVRLYDVFTENVFEKEKDDYIYCLQTASRFPSPYYLVLQDDILLDKHAFETVSFLMKYHNLFSVVDWSFLKLYYPDKWLGYARSWQTVVELGGYSVCGGSVCAGVVLLVISRRRKWSSWNLPLLFWFVMGGLFSILLCLSIGRQYVELWRKYLVSTHRLVTAPGCCIPATVYPAHVISDLCNHLASVYCHNHFSVDIAIDSFAHIRGLKTYLVEPNVGKHIGLISNLRRKIVFAHNFL